MDFTTATPEELIAFASQVTDEPVRTSVDARELAQLRQARHDEAVGLAKDRAEHTELTAACAAMRADIEAVRAFEAALREK